VASPAYLEKHGTPETPEDLLRHECFTFRHPTSGSLFAWERERGKRSWRVPMRGSIVTNNGKLALAMVEKGLGLAYVIEAVVVESLRVGRLVPVLERYAPKVSGLFLYYPSRAQRSGPLRLFVEAAKELAARRGT